MGTIRFKERSASKKSASCRKAERMADTFMRAVYREDRQREARADRKVYYREVNRTRDHHTRDRSITVWRAE